MFGFVTGAAVGAALSDNSTLGAVVGTITGKVIAKAASKSVKYLFDVRASLDADWKPQVFGDWYKDRIAQLLEKDD